MNTQLILWARNIQDLRHRFVFRNALLLSSLVWVGFAMASIGPELFDPTLAGMHSTMLDQAMIQVFEAFMLPAIVAAAVFIAFFNIIIGGLADQHIDESEMHDVLVSAKNSDGAAAGQMAAWYEREGAIGLSTQWYHKAIKSGYQTARLHLKRMRRRMLRERLFTLVRRLWS